ncbi:hypothetical protein AAMO2058_000114400 [Amorphochlora amoebiformis]
MAATVVMMVLLGRGVFGGETSSLRGGITASRSERKTNEFLALNDNKKISELTKKEEKTQSLHLSDQVSESDKVTLAWYDISCTLSTKAGTKSLLKNVTGEAKPGRLLAIMGPSGAGKTTLLKALAGQMIQSKGLKLSGEIEKEGQGGSAFIQQDDIFYSQMTVWETLMFTARLRLPKSISLKIKEERERGNAKSGALRGLDSFQAEAVMESLRALANKGHTVIAVIHQPSGAIFNMVHDLTLLSEGRVVYSGVANQAERFLAKLGNHKPSGVSTPEYLLKVASIDYRSKEKREESTRRVLKVIDAYDTRIGDQKNAALDRIRNDIISGTKSRSHKDEKMQSVHLGTVWIVVPTGISRGTVRAFPKEKNLILTERTKGTYSVFPYFLSKLIAEAPLNAALSLIFAGVIYPLVGFQRDWIKFGKFAALTTAHAMSSSALGLMIGAWAPTTDAALALMPPTIILQVVFNGLNIAEENTPKLLRWIPKVSLIRWCFEGLAVNEFQGLTFEGPKPFIPGRKTVPITITGEQALERVSIQHDSTVLRALLVEVGLLAAFYLKAFLDLRKSGPKFLDIESLFKPSKGWVEKAGVKAA